MEKYDIYLANIKFNPLEFSGKDKNRPVILLDIDLFIPVIPISSKVTKHKNDYIIQDWQKAGLDEPSVAITTNIQLISALNDIKQISKSGEGIKFGHLSERDIAGIKEKIGKR